VSDVGGSRALPQYVHQFGDFLLSPERQMLSYKGQPVALGGRAFDILTLLVRRAGEVVSKAEMFAHVWPDYIVHEHNLKVNVGSLRRLLAQFDPATDYIATIAGRGYKFVVAVESRVDHASRPSAPNKTNHVGLPFVPHLFGRDEAIGQVAEQLQQAGYVTIVGPGGAGKTSLAIKVMQRSCTAGQAIAFVDLSTVSNPRFVVPAIASALGVSLGLDDPIAGVIETIRRHEMPVIIDNCEHVIAMAAAIIERISSELPDVPILATSREPLRTRHERIHFLSGLAYPDGAERLTASEAMHFPAVQLFITKAGSAIAGMTDAYAQSVASICARLEGLALAIELAAGTASVLDPSALEQFFKHGFDTMNRGSRDAPLRHQTMEATLDWSYLRARQSCLVCYPCSRGGLARMMPKQCLPAAISTSWWDGTPCHSSWRSRLYLPRWKAEPCCTGWRRAPGPTLPDVCSGRSIESRHGVATPRAYGTRFRPPSGSGRPRHPGSGSGNIKRRSTMCGR
jgi:DNA-binding winged helix-turn-helix (wHTH) protein